MSDQTFQTPQQCTPSASTCAGSAVAAPTVAAKPPRQPKVSAGKKAKPPAEKKPVGRPRKNTSAEAQHVAGIVTEPVSDDNIFELISTSTTSFKKIIQFYKIYDTGEFQMFLLPSGVVIRGLNHTKDTRVGIFIDGRAMQSYYCESPIELVSKLANFDKSFGAIGKTHNKIVISVSRARPKTLIISLYEAAHAVMTVFETPLATMGACAVFPAISLSEHKVPALRCCIDTKLFKTEITQIHKVSTMMRVTRQKNQPLLIESEQGSIPVSHKFLNDAEIQLEQNFTESMEVFTVSFGSANVKPFATTALGTHVTMEAFNGPQILFSSKSDARGAVYGFVMEILINVNGYAASQLDHAVGV